jgi:hypothetical protein
MNTELSPNLARNKTVLVDKCERVDGEILKMESLSYPLPCPIADGILDGAWLTSGKF